MATEEKIIEKLRTMVESTVAWGDSRDWTNQDFIALSEKIQDKTGVTLSHVTLKRIWGKVRYESLPNTHTLNTLAKFAGFESWRQFRSSQTAAEELVPGTNVQEQAAPAGGDGPNAAKPQGSVQTGTTAGGSSQPKNPRRTRRLVAAIGLAILSGLGLLILTQARKKPHRPVVYAFSSKKTVSVGVPNTVIFDYDASTSPYDSVIIQQSWDTNLRTHVPIGQHQHTSIYYYPDFYYAKLIAGGQLVREHELFIQTDGWLPIIEHTPVPIYFQQQEAMHDGKMSLKPDQVTARNIPLQPSQPNVMFANVRDFGEIYSDDFDFETSLRNDYREGSAVCQTTRVYILCKGTGIWIPLCSKGCVNTVDMLFTDYYTSGKLDDLSPFGVDFSDYVKLRISSHGGHAQIFINDHLAWQVKGPVAHAKIVGIYYRFQGTGSVDYVHLDNGKINYKDEF